MVSIARGARISDALFIASEGSIVSTNICRVAAVVTAAVSGILITGVGTAGAGPTVEAGRGRIQVTVESERDQGWNCAADVPGVGVRQFLVEAGKSASTLFTGLAPGTYSVRTTCVFVDGRSTRWAPDNVTVTASDPMLDAIDGMMAGAGSSAMVSDPTLR